MQSPTLQHHLLKLKRRLLALEFAGGGGWGILLALLILIAAAWLDLMVELSPALRIASLLIAIAATLILLIRSVALAFRHAAPQSLARRLDTAANAHGQILTGVDFTLQSSTASPASAPLSQGLTELAVDRAATLAGSIRPAAAAPHQPLYRPWGLAGTLILGLLILSAAAPRLSTALWLRFTDPFGDHPPYSRISLAVEPGDTRIVYGTSLEVRVRPQGGVIDNPQVILHAADSQGAGGADETLPMFQEADGKWIATVANVTAPATYWVRAPGVRSRHYQLDLITVPKIESARFRVTPPAYTHRPSYEGALPQGGLSGLPGATVEMWIKSNRPLAGGSLQIQTKDSPTTQATTLPTAAVAPVVANSNEVKTTFTIDANATARATVVDVAGQSSTDVFVAPITLLSDDRPFVRLLEPRAQSYATPTVTINISMVAEDDYGISRLQLFRGLNESRVRAEEIPVPPNQPPRLPAQLQLKLSDYGLTPGDIVKLYARVEDNDPAGAKGSESSIAIIRIISQEDLERMQLARQGMEVLQSKYEQARRRLEALDHQLEQLQKDLEKLDPDSELAKAMREKIAKLAEQMQTEAGEIAKSAAQDLPFDIDHAFKKHLQQAAEKVAAAAKATAELAQKGGIGNAAAAKALEQIRKDLAGEQKDLQDKATDPLDNLARIFPLKEDEARFAELYQRQSDLAERTKALEGQEGQDNPRLKSRMRDLETEQRQLQDDLRALLDDIETHAAQLPEDPKLDDLRKSAKEFTQAVKQSGASEEMSRAKTALGEFAGSVAHTRAQSAADILEKFLSKCQGMGDQASTCIRFQPGLEDLGDTVDQLLDAEGLLPGPNGKQGSGGKNGYSARRNSLNNVGIYGNLPTRASMARGGNGHDNRPSSSDGNANPDEDRDPSHAAPNARSRVAGETGAAIPPEYKRRVGAYFQRVADELGDKQD